MNTDDGAETKFGPWLAAVPLIATLAAPAWPALPALPALPAVTYHRHEQMQQPYLPIPLHDETPYFPTGPVSTASVVVSGAGLYPNIAANGA